MLCLFEPRTPPSHGTQSVWLQLWRRRQKYQMPVVPGWHRPLPLSSGSLLGSADADFLLSTTCSENISAVKPMRGVIAALPEEEPLHQPKTARISPVRLLAFKLGATFGLFWCIAVFREKWHFYLRLQRILNTDAWEKLVGQRLTLVMDGAEVNVMAWNCYYTEWRVNATAGFFFSRAALAHHFSYSQQIWNDSN